MLTKEKTNEKIATDTTDAMLKAGVHFGYTKTRRHPSVKSYVLGTKNRVDILDTVKVEELLEKAKVFVTALAGQGKQLLFVGSKPEAREFIKQAAQSLNMPYVIERWIGGTLTNFPEIKKRVDRLNDLKEKKEKGETGVYTKKEQLLIGREIDRLEKYFSGIVAMKNIPGALFIIDSKHEHIALAEALRMKVPTISLSNSDCNITNVTYPIIGNDASTSSISFFVNEIARAYSAGIKVE